MSNEILGSFYDDYEPEDEFETMLVFKDEEECQEWLGHVAYAQKRNRGLWSVIREQGNTPLSYTDYLKQKMKQKSDWKEGIEPSHRAILGLRAQE
jgi:hypothetical protein